VLAAVELAGAERPASEAAAKRTVAAAVKRVAERLGNTPAVCRRSYIDPRVFDRYRDGETLAAGVPRNGVGERSRARIERAVLDLVG
jgi:DNA topoisomerase IB